MTPYFNPMTAVYVEHGMENMHSVKTEEEGGVIIATSSSYDTPASAMHIHANAGDESFSEADEVDSTKSGFIPILTEAMREIIDDHQLATNSNDNSEPIQTVPQQDNQQQYPNYVTVGVIPCDVELKNGCEETGDGQKELPAFMESVHQPSENQNQNNCYQGIGCPNDVTSCSTSAYQIGTPEVHYSVSKPGDCLETHSQSTPQEPSPALSASSAKPVSPKGLVGSGLTIEGPFLNGFQKPKINIVQQILQAFKASSKKEMHPSEVYDAIQKLYPYYRQLNQKKKKSWMVIVLLVFQHFFLHCTHLTLMYIKASTGLCRTDPVT
ncbi:hypothetical protein HOLleu_37612 [Holothuria leucospilota]|uniref:Fork-head domain-containing protein n=1 Tax=Holothuria leucospilota TaxID=206669 RepID=A0A9Q0YL62_HOLLE|nr:hypothetical protein HOLleu_37612 [Holothuria leucospilota]